MGESDVVEGFIGVELHSLVSKVPFPLASPERRAAVDLIEPKARLESRASIPCCSQVWFSIQAN